MKLDVKIKKKDGKIKKMKVIVEGTTYNIPLSFTKDKVCVNFFKRNSDLHKLMDYILYPIFGKFNFLYFLWIQSNKFQNDYTSWATITQFTQRILLFSEGFLKNKKYCFAVRNRKMLRKYSKLRKTFKIFT